MPPYRAGGQAQYVESRAGRAGDRARRRSSTGRASGVGDGISIDDLARHAAMSRRTLTRRFRSTLGVPPGEWLQQERLRLAQQLLETPRRPADARRARAGYDSATTMRAQFASRLRHLAAAPTGRRSARASRRPPASSSTFFRDRTRDRADQALDQVRTPAGSRIITAISTAPKITSGAVFEMSCACTGRNSISAAPKARPHSEPRPAATAPTTRKIESLIG